jgi:hypothetical protein
VCRYPPLVLKYPVPSADELNNPGQNLSPSRALSRTAVSQTVTDFRSSTTACTISTAYSLLVCRPVGVTNHHFCGGNVWLTQSLLFAGTATWYSEHRNGTHGDTLEAPDYRFLLSASADTRKDASRVRRKSAMEGVAQHEERGRSQYSVPSGQRGFGAAVRRSGLESRQLANRFLRSVIGPVT